MNRSNPTNIDEEDLKISLDKGGFNVKKQSFKLEGLDNRKQSNLFSDSSQTNPYRKSGT